MPLQPVVFWPLIELPCGGFYNEVQLLEAGLALSAKRC